MFPFIKKKKGRLQPNLFTVQWWSKYNFASFRCVSSGCGAVVAEAQEVPEVVALELTKAVVVAPPSPTSVMSGDHTKV